MTGPRCGVTKWTKSGSGALVGETAGVHGEKLRPTHLWTKSGNIVLWRMLIKVLDK